MTQPILGTNPAFFFCNGIMNEPQDAESSANLISRAFGNRRVEVLYNPTSLANYKDSSNEQLLCKKARKFAGDIYEEIQKNRPVIIFAHSHGAVLIRKTLYQLSKLDAQAVDQVSVYSFGGAALLKNGIAQRVQNYVYDNDLIADVGNIRSADDELILYNAKRIMQKARENQMAKPLALRVVALEDLNTHLSPIMRASTNERYQVKKDKDAQYQRFFVDRDYTTLHQDPFLLQQIQKYEDIFKTYNIEILEGTPFQDPEYAPRKTHETFGEFLVSAIGNTIKFGSAFAQHAIAHHKFEAYEASVQKVAQQLTG